MSGSLQTKRLGEVAQFIRGITFKPTDVVPLGTPGSIGCFRTKNIQSDIDLSDVFALPSSFLKTSGKLVQEGDLLVSTANSWNLVGKCCWVPHLSWSATVGGFIAALRADEHKIAPRFLYWWFSRAETQERVRNCARQTTNIANLSIDRCLELEIFLPPLDEQRRIVAILDQADALRRKRREALNDLHRLTDALFEEMFPSKSRDWDQPRRPLSSLLVAPLRNGISPSTGGVQEFSVLTLAAITGASFNPNARKVGTFKNPPGQTYKVHKDDFLICRGNGSPDLVGRGLFPTHDMLDTVFPDTIIAGRVNQREVDPAFLQYVWNGPENRQEILKIARTTNGTFKVNQTTLGRLMVSAPSIELQREFGRAVVMVEEERATAEKHLTQLNALFSSLQYRAFRGEL